MAEEWNFRKAICNEGWMDQRLSGAQVSQRDLEVLVLQFADSNRFKVVSIKPLDYEGRRRWWGHITDKYLAPEGQMVLICYDSDPAEYKTQLSAWRKDYDTKKAAWDVIVSSECADK